MDEAAYVNSEVQAVFYPMVSQAAHRTMIMASTQRDRGNWFNTLVKRALTEVTDLRAVVFDYKVCSLCRKEGQEACDHAVHLTPPWYDKEMAAQMMSIANRETLDEMQGLVHGDTRPAFDVEAIRRMLETRVPVPRVNHTIVVGIDPNSGGASDYGLLAATVLDGKLVILGWGVPQVTTTNMEDPNYGPRVFCEFMLGLFDRYGPSFNAFLCVESNTGWHTGRLVELVDSQPWASRVVWLRESKSGKQMQIGLYKDNKVTTLSQFQWHTWMHQGAAVAEEPFVFTGGMRAGPAEHDHVVAELERQFMEYEEVPTPKGGVTYSGKRNGNDDIVGGAGPQVMYGVRIADTQVMRDKYPAVRFTR